MNKDINSLIFKTLKDISNNNLNNKFTSEKK